MKPRRLPGSSRLRLVVMVLMFFYQMPEFVAAYRLLGGTDLRLRPGEYLFGTDTVGGVFHDPAPLDRVVVGEGDVERDFVEVSVVG